MEEVLARRSRVHRWSLVEGMGRIGSVVDAEVEGWVEGRRKGREPVGEAWLFEGMVMKERPVNLRYACRELVSLGGF